MILVFDTVAAIAILILATPLILLISIAIITTMGLPILFIQKRPGYREKIFILYKFRTMNNAEDEKGNLLSDEQRLTKLGKILRSYSLDELPQLWNIIIGDMSLVGPRPLLVEYLKEYDDVQRKRHDVKPGITGWAQINGRNLIGWEEKFKLDIWYVEHRSLLLNLKILILTIWSVIKKEGISQKGEATMGKYLPNRENE